MRKVQMKQTAFADLFQFVHFLVHSLCPDHLWLGVRTELLRINLNEFYVKLQLCFRFSNSRKVMNKQRTG